MTIQQLKYIIAIDRHRNFAKAAEELGVTQPLLTFMPPGMMEERIEKFGIRIAANEPKRMVNVTELSQK